MRRIRKVEGFTIIELMIVVAIIGILALFALPAYQDYTKRTYVGEGIELATAARLAVVEHFTDRGEWAENNEALGLADKLEITGTAVQSIEVKPAPKNDPTTGNTIEILYTRKVDALNNVARLVAKIPTNSASIIWLCGAPTQNGVNYKYLPSNCRMNVD